MRTNTWIVLANSSKATIIDDPTGGHPLGVVEEISAPEGRAKSSELVSDQPNRVQDASGERAALAPRIDPRRNAQEHFAREIATFLETARRKNMFGSLVLASSEPFLGILLKECGEQLHRLVRKHVPHDLADIPLRDLRDAISAYETPSEKRARP